jgi:hypothetical protein
MGRRSRFRELLRAASFSKACWRDAGWGFAVVLQLALEPFNLRLQGVFDFVLAMLRKTGGNLVRQLVRRGEAEEEVYVGRREG